MSYMDELLDMDEAVREAAPEAVRRYRDRGILTWSLLHLLENEILDELAATGEFTDTALRMIRSAGLMNYPKDERPVSFGGSELIPFVFSEIERAWNRVH